MSRPSDNRAAIATHPWFDTPLGSAVLGCEEAMAARLLERVFGFVAVSIGHWWPADLFLAPCSIRQQLRIGDRGDLVSPLDNLALASDSIDAVLLPHTLEFVASPQRLLREVDRVLVGEGHVLVFGFNPWSAWSARRMARSGHFPENGRPLAAGRLVDWLNLLGFEVLATEGVFRRPPINHAGMLDRLDGLDGLEKPHWLPVPGNAYAILARKHVYAMTPLKPAWERRRRLTAGLPTPAGGMNNSNKQEKICP
ncbi:MAG: class I SAM-dependent methyltransferase [Proteobacteria bacterium]|nr:class I SAM-dependent methyltransferase [Pseudomonadota bacterium]